MAPFFVDDQRRPLAIVLCHFNPCLFQNPVQNLRAVLSSLGALGLPVFAAELRCGASLSAPPVLPSNSERVLHLTSDSIFFRKENLWNVVERQLPRHIDRIVCIDADVIFSADGWYEALSAELERSRFVQPFSRAVWLDSLGQPYRTKIASAHAFGHGVSHAASGKAYHCGFAVALKREFWKATGGLFNGILGEGASALMAAAMDQQDLMRPYFRAISAGWASAYADWATRVTAYVQRDISCLPGDATHLWHGATSNRKYIWYRREEDPELQDRRRWLAGYDPQDHHIEDADTGLLHGSDHAVECSPELVRGVGSYFEGRDEDSWYHAGASS